MKQFFSLLVVLMLFSVNAVAIETTPTGFYYPTGTSDPGPFAGWLSSGCNPGDPYFPGLYHIGHDYQTDLGAPVYLISDGIIADVSYGGWGETDGQTNVAIFVRHELSDGTFFLALYGHIQSSFTDEDVGVSVYAGNTLGVVGDWDYGIHLHFGVRPGTEIPLTNWGRMPCDSWPDTNGFVDPINWIENQIPAGSVPGSLVGYFIDGWNPDISPKFLDKYNDMATAGHPLGDPWDNGGSVFVHDLNDMWIQDFNGPDNGWDLPYTALIYYEDPWV
ncbi:MAG: peptidoglycan DD-metalloendopeptidase family protein, partial [Candidatus Komeilibacteria bacterium]|nr:peptidoglycan DD-metalloendopeptidase family protein [Candidatus Komeilibacteria bacterium]